MKHKPPAISKNRIAPVVLPTLQIQSVTSKEAEFG